jgi:hypothetical protein
MVCWVPMVFKTLSHSTYRSLNIVKLLCSEFKCTHNCSKSFGNIPLLVLEFRNSKFPVVQCHEFGGFVFFHHFVLIVICREHGEGVEEDRWRICWNDYGESSCIEKN